MKKLLRYPLFLLLLPVFFVFHGYVENYYFMIFQDCLGLLGMYIAATIAIYLAARLLLKDGMKAALFAAYIMAVYFFFGALHDFLRKNNIFLNRYTLLLPALVLVTVLVALFIRKSRPFLRLPVFLNSLFLLYMLLDAGILAEKALAEKQVPPVDHSLMSAPVTRCDSCGRPDIYFILFDEYCNSKTLKEIYHYDNSSFDSFLMSEGFHIQWNSRSNYGSTLMSMASALNYSYLKDLKSITFRSYKDMLDAIAKNKVVNFLYAQGYAVVNNSPFDVPGHPSDRSIPFIPLKARLISNRTLLNYLMLDLEGHMKNLLWGSAGVASNIETEADQQNRRALEETKKESGKKAGTPRFVYTHLLMPHPPYLYDSLLHRRDHYDIASHLDEGHPRYYLNYIPYTNACARNLITTIKKNTGGKAVIIFMSDHGFRYTTNGKMTRYFFDNQNAVYFPDKDYHSFYDSISSVNQFRVVFNKLFRQNLPLLKDSIILLQEPILITQ